MAAAGPYGLVAPFPAPLEGLGGHEAAPASMSDFRQPGTLSLPDA